MRILLFITVLCFSEISTGDCIHYEKGNRLGVDDGPGTYGLLDGTMTIDCLKFIDIEKEGQQIFGILKDDQGKKYRVKVGSNIGRYGGEITEIKNNKIIYETYIEENDGWQLITREMILNKSNKSFEKDNKLPPN